MMCDTLSNISDGRRVERVIDMSEGHAVIQSDVKRMKKWADKKIDKERCKALHLKNINPKN